MRLIRLAKTDPAFPNIAAVHDYFLNPESRFYTLGQGFATFIFNGRGHIGADGLRAGETLLFSYERTVHYVATAWSGRMDWTGIDSDRWPHCFQVNVASLRRVCFTVQQLAEALEVAIPEPQQNWPPLPDGIQAEWAVNNLACGPLICCGSMGTVGELTST
jgi:hypothetical protein